MNRGDGQSMGSLGRSIGQPAGKPANGVVDTANNYATAQPQAQQVKK